MVDFDIKDLFFFEDYKSNKNLHIYIAIKEKRVHNI